MLNPFFNLDYSNFINCSILPVFFTVFQKQVIVGNLLGDGSLRIIKNNGKYCGNTRLQFHFKSEAYSLFILELYASLCTITRKLTPVKIDNTLNPTQVYHFATWS